MATIDDCTGYAIADLAWAAGFLDGEGYFGIAKSGTIGGKHRRSVVIEAAQVATDAPLVQLHSLFGGSLTRRRTHNQAWMWKLSGTVAVGRAIALLHPYLVVKQEQALVVLTFCAATRPRGGPYSLHGPYPEGEQELRARLEQQLLDIRKAA